MISEGTANSLSILTNKVKSLLGKYESYKNYRAAVKKEKNFKSWIMPFVIPIVATLITLGIKSWIEQSFVTIEELKMKLDSLAKSIQIKLTEKDSTSK